MPFIRVLNKRLLVIELEQFPMLFRLMPKKQDSESFANMSDTALADQCMKTRKFLILVSLTEGQF